jgi:hypothetical protein
MSRETEIINVDEMVGRLLIDGKVIAVEHMISSGVESFKLCNS